MEPDWYCVEILHYLNPHLIWVKVCNRSATGYSLEQIGVYGVLPLDIVLDIGTDAVQTKRCEAWQQAATMVMKKVLMEATEVRFLPTHIDRRSSIFDTNTHKYGELLIKKADGKLRKLSHYLQKSGFAIYDEAAFHQELSLGHISTKLSKNMIDEVMNIITKSLPNNDSEVAFKQQTTVYQAAKQLEALTAANLDRHNRQFKKTMKGDDVLNILDRKFKDLELCKDVDETSAGRAIRRSKMRDIRETFDKVHVKDYAENDTTNSEVIKPCDDFEDSIKENVSKHSEPDISVERKPTTVHDVQQTNDKEVTYLPRRNLNQIRKKSSKSKMPNYDVLTQKCVAYSPPGVDKMKLRLKIVPIMPETTQTRKIDKEDEIQISEIKDDMFGEVDSHVNIQITNKDVLKKYNDETYEDRKVSHEVVDATIKADDSSSETQGSVRRSKLLQKKLRIHNEKLKRHEPDSGSSLSNTTSKDTTSSGDGQKEDSDDDIRELIEKYKASNAINVNVKEKKTDANMYLVSKKNYVNPFKNVDPNLSVFVDKLINPVLMVHTKNNARIEPRSNLSDIPFNRNIHNVLKNMNVQQPMTMQSVSWFSVLRGYSVMLIGPKGCGKTMGYLPSVCRLISDDDNQIANSVGPTCVIVCATAKSVSDVEHKSRMLLSPKEKIFSCYAGTDLLNITTSLLNGCDLFICTPCVLARLLVQTEFALDLRRLTTFVLDDCERLDEVYQNEIKVVLFKIRDMLKSRVYKEVKVQYILASRVWCDFMEPLAKKAPDTVICIGAFQECVLYSKANTTVDFVKGENKNTKVLEFLKENDNSKKTVIVCRRDEEVDELERILKEKYIVFASNSKMTVEDLRSLNKAWNDYAEPLLGPILVCCDGNLSHMNVTDAHYLLHYSMPDLFSMFCKRFSVLNDYYPSIFKAENESVSIKIILEESNSEQLPKICNFVKRCTKEIPNTLNVICQKILTRKDLARASEHVPICGNLLSLGECPDFWNCRERHTLSKTHDAPKEWMPTEGTITFEILHYHTASWYSARLLSNIKKGGTQEYSQTLYSLLSLKMGMYFSQDSNRKLHGIPKIGDICAVAIKENFFVRCQVVDITNRYRATGNPNHVLVKLIDEEKFETSRDIYLYHLPKELKEIETHVVQVRLAGVVPKDKDITFSDLAKHQLMTAVGNDDTYMRGKVALTVSNQIFVDNIDVCQDLSSLNEIVVKNNFKEILEPHSAAFPDHLEKLKSRLLLGVDTYIDNTDFEEVEEMKPAKATPKAQWAHLNREGLSLVYFYFALDPSTFFVRLSKSEICMEALGKDIDKYVLEKPDPLTNVKENDIVLARFPDDECYERARVDTISGNKAKCFFVDLGYWRQVPLNFLIEIPDKFITCLPFQAIECRLIGVRPAGDSWTDFSTNWLCDRCDDNLRGFYVQQFSSEKADYTGGTKYAVALIDTTGEEDVVFNNLMIDLNLAAPDENEIDILDGLDYTKEKSDGNTPDVTPNDDDMTPLTNGQTNGFPGKLIRSVPLIRDDDSDSDWSINMPRELMQYYTNAKSAERESAAKPQEKSDDSSNEKATEVSNGPALSDYELVPAPKIEELDSDDFSSAGSQNTKSELLKEVSHGRKPKILWRQNKLTATLKIMLLGVEKYEISIQDRAISFSANVCDTAYDFNLDLYGVIDKKQCSHSNKGQYILVKLVKLLKKNWLSLSRSGSTAKWIVFDVDFIETSSDEEEPVDNHMAEDLKSYHKDDSDSDESCFYDADYMHERR